MDYEKKYKEALEKARQLCAYPTTKPFISDLQDIFPELKESEDERIRKEIIELVMQPTWKTEKEFHRRNELCVWLEKQGEQKPIISNNALREGITHFGITQYQIDNWLKKYVDVEKQGEQESEEFDDTNAKRMFIKALERVEEQNNKGYKLTDCDKNSWWEDFKAYTSCIVEQKPAAWSDEDEILLKLSLENLTELKDRFGKYYGRVGGCIDWLKSLKGKYTWKPSDEQMDALHYVTNFDYGGHKATLVSLYEQLKKLK